MIERHEIEQFFWDDATLVMLAGRASTFERPCCLCAPLLGRELHRRGHAATVLDIDERFAQDAGFQRFDLYRPDWRAETYGLIVCDPPFWKVSLSQLFTSIRVLAHHDWEQPILIAYPKRRAANVCGTFARFGLQPLPWAATYRTLPDTKRTRDGIIFYTNVAAWLEEDAADCRGV